MAAACRGPVIASCDKTGVKPASVQFSLTLLSQAIQIKEYWDYRDSVVLKRFASGVTL